MQTQVDNLKPLEVYNKVYSLQGDISEIVERLQNNPNDYAPPVVDENNNIVVGIDTWRAFAQLGIDNIKVSKQPFKSENEKILTMIVGCDHTNRSKEEYCRAVSMYCKAYSELFPQGSEGYKPIKKLYGDLPSIFKIQSCDPGKTKSLSACGYSDYQYVGNKIFELEEQNRIDDLTCLLIELEQFAPSYLRDNKILSQVDSWTDEDREQIRQMGRESGVSMRRFYDLNRKIQDKPKQKETVGSSRKEVLDNLYNDDPNRKSSADSKAATVYGTLYQAYDTLQLLITENYKDITDEGENNCRLSLAILAELEQLIISRFGL